MQRISINVGDRVELEHIRSATRRKLSENRYTSQLLDYDGFRTAKIAMPIFAGKVIPLEVGDEYKLHFFTNNSMSSCDAKVVRRAKENNMFVTIMEFTTLVKKNQRRQFYRLDCAIPMKFRCVSEEETKILDLLEHNKTLTDEQREELEKRRNKMEQIWNEAVLSDISGGGGRFQGTEHAQPGSLIEVAIPLSINEEITIFKSFARVIVDVPVPNTNNNEIRCEFKNIDRIKQELVVKYVFAEQKRRMRKD